MKLTAIAAEPPGDGYCRTEDGPTLSADQHCATTTPRVLGRLALFLHRSRLSRYSPPSTSPSSSPSVGNGIVQSERARARVSSTWGPTARITPASNSTERSPGAHPPLRPLHIHPPSPAARARLAGIPRARIVGVVAATTRVERTTVPGIRDSVGTAKLCLAWPRR